MPNTLSAPAIAHGTERVGADAALVPLAPELTRAVAGGICWAVVSLWVTELPLRDLVALAIGASATLLCWLLAWGALDASPKQGAKVALGAALLCLVALVIGQVLQAHTHHRPLGAVAWTLLLAAAIGPVVAVVNRLRPSPLFGAAAFVLASAALLWLGRGAIGPSAWIQWGAGLACALATVIHRARWPRSGSALGWPVGCTLLAAMTWALWSNPSAEAIERAPLVLGLLSVL